MSSHEEARRALHQLNGVMINHLVSLFPDIDWGDWIVNAIILHRTLAAVETVTLETSATLHRGVPYFSAANCNNDAPVKRLDAEVPLDASYAGHCIRTSNTAWVDDLAKDPLQKAYRSFGYVGVSTFRRPKAEYVFPIRLRTGLSEAIWGVLNCEWYGEQSASPFQGRQTLVEECIGKLLSVHARFLPAVIDPDESVSDADLSLHNEPLFRYYADTLKHLVLPAARLEGDLHESQ